MHARKGIATSKGKRRPAGHGLRPFALKLGRGQLMASRLLCCDLLDMEGAHGTILKASKARRGG